MRLLWRWYYRCWGINTIRLMGYLSFRQSWANGLVLPASHPLRTELPCPVSNAERVAYEKVLRRCGW